MWNKITGWIFGLYQRLTANRRMVRYGLLTLNVLILAAIAAFAIRGSEPASVLNRSAYSLSNTPSDPLDQLSSADIAVNAAQAVALPETTGVSEKAYSVASELAVAPADVTVVAKPQTVATSLKSKADIVEYTTVAGDTVAGIAAKFGVTSDSIMWSNNLRSSTVLAGTKLLVPPVNGIVYTAQAGDTPDSLAQRFRASKDQIITANDIEITGIKPGDRLLIPGGQVVTNIVTRALQATYGYNGYDRGFCTWYVANRRTEINRPLPATLGNASTWDDRAIAFRLPVNHTPDYGAAVVTSNRGAGHVAFVERVEPDGSVWISEMNSRGQRSIEDPTSAGGWGKVDFKKYTAAQAASFAYIH